MYAYNVIGGGLMFFEYNDLKIRYEIFGEGKPLLVLHGWMGCVETMSPIYNFFQKDRKVIVIDFPGQGGKSDILREAWGVPEYAELVNALLKELQVDKCDVIGHSFGGRVIIYLASKYQNMFDKIVLVDSAGIKPKMTLKKFFKIYSYKCARNILKVFLPKDKYEQKLKQYREKNGSSDYNQLSSDVMRETFKKVINLDLTENLSKIANPTLIMWGELDTDTPLYMAKIMEKKIKDSGLVVLKGAGHFSYLDSMGQFLNVVNVFLGGE